MTGIEVPLTGRLTLIAALAAGRLPGAPVAGAAEAIQSANESQTYSQIVGNYPAPGELDAGPVQGGERLEQSRFQDAAGRVRPLAIGNRDVRISLLLALLESHRRAEAVDHPTTATEDNSRLEHAYLLLARAYTQGGQQDKNEEVVGRLTAVRKGNRPTQCGRMNDVPGGN
ncbi:MAG TPA: hypothetical protein VHZ09_10825 [Acidobacteriaceae bacterium]|jgi:hypothetical protein|nr:hypothetical protein [Acidobacteriaceae bacterium]